MTEHKEDGKGEKNSKTYGDSFFENERRVDLNYCIFCWIASVMCIIWALLGDKYIVESWLAFGILFTFGASRFSSAFTIPTHDKISNSQIAYDLNTYSQMEKKNTEERCKQYAEAAYLIYCNTKKEIEPKDLVNMDYDMSNRIDKKIENLQSSRNVLIQLTSIIIGFSSLIFIEMLLYYNDNAYLNNFDNNLLIGGMCLIFLCCIMGCITILFVCRHHILERPIFDRMTGNYLGFHLDYSDVLHESAPERFQYLMSENSTNYEIGKMNFKMICALMIGLTLIIMAFLV